MITLQELCHYLNGFLQTALFEDYCPNGLQLEGKNEVKRIATAVTADWATIQQAASAQVDLLLVHHGLFWNRDPYPITGIKKEKIALLLKHNISLLAYHLPLDAHPEIGNNWKAAKDLGWQELQPFSVGVKGRVSHLPVEQCIRQLEQYYDHHAVSALGGAKTIHSIALISGGAYKSLSDAAKESIDLFITGNYDEPAWNVAFEEKINFAALGHTATEKIGPKALGEHLKQQFNLEVRFIDTANPF
jgi:dinuclear metal center YbgI/SA1388 family protein